MITYIINTSNNKTFDCDQLFKLAGYNKTIWINTSLDNVRDCVDFIKNKQGTIVFEKFRLAIIVDFFEYDRIRVPYGTLSFAKEEGVDFSVYLPYIEAYINDKLLFELEKIEFHPTDCSVYYIKCGEVDYVERINNLESQVKQILSPVEESFVCKQKVSYNAVVDVYTDTDGKEITQEEYIKLNKELAELNEMLDTISDSASREEVLNKLSKKSDLLASYRQKKQLVRKVDEEDFYTSFSLHCSENLSLVFNIEDYPYILEGDACSGVSQRLFFRAFNERIGKTRRITRHFYQTDAGNSVAKAAFDNFSLSLYLIKIYESGAFVDGEGELDIDGLDTNLLKDLLLNAWNKIVVARNLSKENQSLYYSLKTLSETKITSKIQEELPYEEQVTRAKSLIAIKDNKVKTSIEEQYKQIKEFGDNQDVFLDEDKEEFNKIILSYLENRDKTKEKDVEYKYEQLIRSDAVVTTNMCPSKQEFQEVIGEKHDEISKYLGESLKDECLVVSFEKERNRADKCYKDYLLYKNVLSKNASLDIVFLILAVAIMVVPFIYMKIYSNFGVASVLSWLNCAAVFAGVYIFSLILIRLPALIKLNKAKFAMLDCYKTCLAKKKIAIKKLQKRYNVDLIKVEEYRHEIKLLTMLYNDNVKKEKNINNHRVVLESVENCLSGILNNLGIYPAVDTSVSVEGEFNVMLPISSSENSIYKIFALEAIEDLLIKKSR